MRVWRHPFLAALGVLVIAVAALALLWDWNWFNPLVARAISQQLGRPVSIARVDVQDLLTGDPLVVLDDITIGNPPGFPGANDFGSIGRLSVRFAGRPFIESRGQDIDIREIALDKPQGDLRVAPNGERNWVFNLPGASSSARSVTVGALVISDGAFRINDPKLKADLAVPRSWARASASGRPWARSSQRRRCCRWWDRGPLPCRRTWPS